MSYQILKPTVVAALTIILCSGCASHYRVQPILSTDQAYGVTWKEKRYESFLWLKTDRYSWERELINPFTYNPADVDDFSKKKLSKVGKSLYAIAAGKAEEDGVDRKEARNRLQNAILGLSDRVTARHMSALKSTENGINGLLGAATIGLSGGASVAAPHSAKALSAAATGTAGGRELFNDQVLRNALGESIIGAIEADREKFRSQTILVNQRKGIEDYDVEAAIRDANEYHFRGSLYHGMALVRESAEKANAAKLDDAKAARAADPKAVAKLKARIADLIKLKADAAKVQGQFDKWKDKPEAPDFLRQADGKALDANAFLLTEAANNQATLESLLDALLK